jgi:hypothetical protein
MRLAVLGEAFDVLPVDMYFSQTSLVGNRFSTRLNITPFGEDAVFMGGRIRVRLAGGCVADISLRRALGLKLPRDEGYRLPIQVELPAMINPSRQALTVAGYILYSNPQSGTHFRCALAPDGSIQMGRVTGVKVKLLQWFAAWRDFFREPLD